ncbi:MAG: amidohydrolase family protein [Planctomycetes bacterium]|nr:amidohydrolase family protein [Planctomycetota bacterium]
MISIINLILASFLSVQDGAASTPAKSAQSKPAANPAATTIAIRAKRLHTMTGDVLADGVVVVRDGKIAAVGANIDIPAGATTLDCEDLTPGLIDANCSVGQTGMANEDSSEITPSFRAVDDLDAAPDKFLTLLKSGVTTIFAPPGNRNVVGGLAAIVKTSRSDKVNIINPAWGIKFCLTQETMYGNYSVRGSGVPRDFHARRPQSRPGAVMELRIALNTAANWVGKLGIIPPNMKPLVDVFEANLPVRIHALNLGEMRNAMRVAKEFDLKDITIDGAIEAHRCLADIKALNVKIVLHPHSIDPMAGVDGNGGRLDYGDEHPAQDELARLVDAGVPVALSSYGGRENLATQMRIAHRYGATADVALNAVTRGAAELLKINDRVGTIATGKDADLVLWNGDPSEFTTAAKVVIVDGRVAWRDKE